jgi:hypothetical protein
MNPTNPAPLPVTPTPAQRTATAPPQSSSSAPAQPVNFGTSSLTGAGHLADSQAPVYQLYQQHLNAGHPAAGSYLVGSNPPARYVPAARANPTPAQLAGLHMQPLSVTNAPHPGTVTQIPFAGASHVMPTLAPATQGVKRPAPAHDAAPPAKRAHLDVPGNTGQAPAQQAPQAPKAVKPSQSAEKVNHAYRVAKDRAAKCAKSPTFDTAKAFTDTTAIFVLKGNDGLTCLFEYLQRAFDHLEQGPAVLLTGNEAKALNSGSDKLADAMCSAVLHQMRSQRQHISNGGNPHYATVRDFVAGMQQTLRSGKFHREFVECLDRAARAIANALHLSHGTAAIDGAATRFKFEDLPTRAELAARAAAATASIAVVATITSTSTDPNPNPNPDIYDGFYDGHFNF